MMRRIKKTIMILSLTLCIFLLTGWGKKTVELLNDTLLIDLNKAIKESLLGNQGNTPTLEEKEAESGNAIEDSQTANTPDKAPATVQEEKTLYIITVNDRTITYNNSVCEPDVLKNKIISDCGNGAGSVYLVDDYAEAHVYNEVLAILKQLHETTGLEYSFD